MIKIANQNFLGKMVTIVVIILAAATFSSAFGNPRMTQNVKHTEEPLILTPYLKAGKIEEAQHLSEVRDLAGGFRKRNINLVSYSGYFTVNETYNSNMFFWFFPAHFNRESAPVLLWLQGGPGSSSMFGLFIENGPMVIDKYQNVDFRDTTWSLTNSVLYLDNPVGAGFSFTNNPDGYARSESDVADGLHNALTQFFTLFPEYRSRDFYATGESYAGKYVPALAVRIHEENEKPESNMRIKLKGIVVGDGWTDPISLINFSQFLYNVGVIDSKQRGSLEIDEERIRALIKKENYDDANQAMNDLVWSGILDHTPSKLTNITGLNFIYNMLYAKQPPEFENYIKYLENPHVRKAIHVGNQPYSDYSMEVWKAMQKDMLKSEVGLMTKLLDAPQKYRILIYQGQLDYCVTVTGTENYLEKLQWHGQEEWNTNATRQIWHVARDVAGYVKILDNLTFLVVRDAGHMVPFDQPEWSFDMINRFLKGKPFNTLQLQT